VGGAVVFAVVAANAGAVGGHRPNPAALCAATLSSVGSFQREALADRVAITQPNQINPLTGQTAKIALIKNKGLGSGRLTVTGLPTPRKKAPAIRTRSPRPNFAKGLGSKSTASATVFACGSCRHFGEYAGEHPEACGFCWLATGGLNEGRLARSTCSQWTPARFLGWRP
jgi:hypothetical protein